MEDEKDRVNQLRGLLDDKVSESLEIQLALQKEQREHKSDIDSYRQGNIKLRETIKRMESDFTKIRQRIRGLLDEPLSVVVGTIDEITSDIDVALAQNGGDCSRLLLGDSELVNVKEESLMELHLLKSMDGTTLKARSWNESCIRIILTILRLAE